MAEAATAAQGTPEAQGSAQSPPPDHVGRGAGQDPAGDGTQVTGQDDKGQQPQAPEGWVDPQKHQKELERIGAKEKREGKKSGRQELLEELGFESEDDARATAEAMRLIDEESQTEVERAQTELGTIKQERDTLKQQNSDLQRQIRQMGLDGQVEKAMRLEGVQEKYLAAAMKLADTSSLVDSDEVSDEDIASVVADVRRQSDVFFGPKAPDLGGGQNPGGGGAGGASEEPADVWAMSSEDFQKLATRAVSGENVTLP